MTESLSGETKPLLAKHVSQFPPTHDQQQHRHPNQQFYNAAPQHIPLKLTGRGKLRFTMRQQLPIKRRREKAQGTSQHAVFNALFAAQKIRHHKDMNPPIESARGESKSQNKNVLIPQNSFEQSNKQSAILPAVEEKLDSPLDFDKGRPKHSQLYHTLNSKSRSAPARLFQKFITSIILIDSIVYILSTEPKFSNSSFFYIFEGLTSIIFLIEYISR